MFFTRSKHLKTTFKVSTEKYNWGIDQTWSEQGSLSHFSGPQSGSALYFLGAIRYTSRRRTRVGFCFRETAGKRGGQSPSYDRKFQSNRHKSRQGESQTGVLRHRPSKARCQLEVQVRAKLKFEFSIHWIWLPISNTEASKKVEIVDFRDDK